MPPRKASSTATKIERWFEQNQRPLPWRARYDPWHVWLSEIMLQQTRVDVVLPYFERFTKRFPNVASAAAADEQEILALWSGLGYYRRASLLHRGTMAVMEKFDGAIPATAQELLSIPGIGRYTAGAIASIAFGRKEPIVDGNVTRVLSRFHGLTDPLGSGALAKRVWTEAERLVSAAETARTLNQGLMELGALICTPRNPSCGDCPLSRACEARASGQTAELPRTGARAKAVRLQIPLYIIADEEGRVLMRRETGPLMRAIYHLPHGDSSLLAHGHFDAIEGPRLGNFRHTITTRRIEFTVYRASPRPLPARNDDYEWIAPSALPNIPHPSYVRKALELAFRELRIKD